MIKYAGLLLIFFATYVIYSIFTVIYTSIVIYWLIKEKLFTSSSPNYEVISKIISISSYLQLISPLIPIDSSTPYGNLNESSYKYILNALILILFSTMARENLNEIDHSYHLPLNPSKKSSTYKKLLVLLLYFLSKICLFL